MQSQQCEFRFELPPLVVSYGGGVDSTAMLVGFYQREIRLDQFLEVELCRAKP